MRGHSKAQAAMYMQELADTGAPAVRLARYGVEVFLPRKRVVDDALLAIEFATKEKDNAPE